MMKNYSPGNCSTSAVKSMAFGRRKCVLRNETDKNALPDDARLKVFKQYSREACLMECRARIIMKECGCLPYYYPDFRKVWRKDTACNIKGLGCLAKKRATLIALTPDDGKTSKKVLDQLIAGAKCDCPNDCEETNYHMVYYDENIVTMSKLSR